MRSSAFHDAHAGSRRNDTFDAALMLEVLGGFRKEVCDDTETALGYDAAIRNDTLEPFGMIAAGRSGLSRSANGVSKRHGEVCARMAAAPGPTFRSRSRRSLW